MTGASVTVVATGSANLASVVAALTRANARVTVATSPSELSGMERLVLPGVGSFGAVMTRLRAAGFVDPLRHWIVSGRPLLAICLGLQILARDSEEAPGLAGLGIWTSAVRRLPATVRCPQLGWNQVRVEGGDGALTDGHAWFANSFAMDAPPTGWRSAWSDHGGPFLAAAERGPQLACQFHPELSGTWGAGLIARWLGSC